MVSMHKIQNPICSGRLSKGLWIVNYLLADQFGTDKLSDRFVIRIYVVDKSLC